MSNPNYGRSYDKSDALGDILDLAAKICMWLGIICIGIGAGFLVFNYVHFSSQSTNSGALGITSINLFSKILVAGALAAGVGSSYLYWGEEFLVASQIILAGALFFAPMYLPTVTGVQGVNDMSEIAAQQIQKGGVFLGVIALLGLVAEVIQRVRARMLQGARSDQLKFGRGVQEEKHQNHFLGKCWQLPFCRKFVRERCPIYHSRRTCWKERVGCMCEEAVIQNAMEGKAIPKDAIAAARYIPVNNKITMAQKKERCRQCVIYNEHVKHKYKLALPITVGTFILLYLLFREPMLHLSQAAITQINNQISQQTYGQAKIQKEGVMIFREILVDCLMFVALAYILKLLEFVFFKMKV